MPENWELKPFALNVHKKQCFNCEIFKIVTRNESTLFFVFGQQRTNG